MLLHEEIKELAKSLSEYGVSTNETQRLPTILITSFEPFGLEIDDDGNEVPREVNRSQKVADLLPELLKKYEGKVNFVFEVLPVNETAGALIQERIKELQPDKVIMMGEIDLYQANHVMDSAVKNKHGDISFKAKRDGKATKNQHGVHWEKSAVNEYVTTETLINEYSEFVSDKEQARYDFHQSSNPINPDNTMDSIIENAMITDSNVDLVDAQSQTDATISISHDMGHVECNLVTYTAMTTMNELMGKGQDDVHFLHLLKGDNNVQQQAESVISIIDFVSEDAGYIGNEKSNNEHLPNKGKTSGQDMQRF